MARQGLAKIIARLVEAIASRLDIVNLRPASYISPFSGLLHGTTVLELGCGPGVMTPILRLNSGSLVSIDLAPHHFRTIPGRESSNFICADARELPFIEKCFDNVVTISVFEHVPHPELAVEESSRVLKKKGHLIVQLPNPQWYIEPHVKFPLFFLFPSRLKETLRRNVIFAYTNWKLSLKKFLELSARRFTLERRTSAYHAFRTPPWPPGWLLLMRKRE